MIRRLAAEGVRQGRIDRCLEVHHASSRTVRGGRPSSTRWRRQTQSVNETLLRVIETAAVAAFAYGGAQTARSRGMDIVGIAVLAVVSGLAGGVLRDIVIDAPVLAVHDGVLLPVCLLVALVVGASGASVHRTVVDVVDAVGLGLFTVIGTERALDAGVTPLAATALGAVTVAAGSVARDVLAGDRPALLYRSELYVILSAAGGGLYVLGDRFEVPPGGSLAGIAASVTVLRLVSLRRGWLSHTPSSRA